MIDIYHVHLCLLNPLLNHPTFPLQGHVRKASWCQWSCHRCGFRCIEASNFIWDHRSWMGPLWIADFNPMIMSLVVSRSCLPLPPARLERRNFDWLSYKVVDWRISPFEYSSHMGSSKRCKEALGNPARNNCHLGMVSPGLPQWIGLPLAVPWCHFVNVGSTSSDRSSLQRLRTLRFSPWILILCLWWLVLLVTAMFLGLLCTNHLLILVPWWFARTNEDMKLKCKDKGHHVARFVTSHLHFKTSMQFVTTCPTTS